MLELLDRFWCRVFPDNRPEHEKERERQFIDAVNQLKTLRTTSRGGMSIDPEEVRDQVLKSREAYRELVSPQHRKR
ncbi:hypothetical protein SB757_02190 [Pseudomonas sp. SIMBA_065]|jgi:hypothetical protein